VAVEPEMINFIPQVLMNRPGVAIVLARVLSGAPLQEPPRAGGSRNSGSAKEQSGHL